MRRIKTLSYEAKGSGKLYPNDDGPFEIFSFKPPTGYWLEGVDKRQSDKLHVSQLKRYVPPTGVKQ